MTAIELGSKTLPWSGFNPSSNEYREENAFEVEHSFITHVTSSEGDFIVKQIKCPLNQYQIVSDVAACHIAASLNIPINKVVLIPSQKDFIGKKIVEFPATLHTVAKGSCIDNSSHHQDIDIIQQCNWAVNCPWRKSRELLPLDKEGMSQTVILGMSAHRDLPKITALDTFVGNADRSRANLFYDEITDSFCGIDMGESFQMPLGSIAYRQLVELPKKVITGDIKTALASYLETMKTLVDRWPPEQQKQLLKDYYKQAGFTEGSCLLTKRVLSKMQSSFEMIDDNYRWCQELLTRRAF